MFESIYYNYAQNFDGLDQIQRAHSSATEFSEHMDRAIKALGPVLEGATGDTAQTMHQQHRQVIEDCLHRLQQHHQQGVQAQHDMKCVDNHCASGLA